MFPQKMSTVDVLIAIPLIPLLPLGDVVATVGEVAS